jgi:Abnormal spindle-like microcephaly-assoc'd, ASPM-SPD-2-Hydin
MFPPNSPRLLLSLVLGLALLLVCVTSTSAGAQGSHTRTSLLDNPTSLAFGTVQVGNSMSLNETITNPTNWRVSISQATVTGSGFSLAGLNTPLTLDKGQSYTFQVSFGPRSAGQATGSISVLSSLSTLSIPLSATGAAAGQLTISPATLSFGSVAVGTSSSLSASLAAAGSNVTVSSATSNSSEFSVTGLSLPVTLVAGRSISFGVKFAPQSSGSASAKISFNNGSGSATVETVTGTGITSSTHRVSLSWKDSSMPAGYNIYRSTKSGGPYAKLNSALVLTSSFTDSSVQAGQSYYYVTTAVSTKGTESGYSNQVQAVIPNP